MFRLSTVKFISTPISEFSCFIDNLNALPMNMAPPVQVVTTNVEVDALRRMLGIPGRWSPSFT
jgi:hypothetical protein